MNKKFLIRAVALKLLEMIYLKSDSNFQATINAYELVDGNIDKTTVQKAGTYLAQKNFINSNQTACDTWTVTIKAGGIDWLEDNHNINPCSYFSK